MEVRAEATWETASGVAVIEPRAWSRAPIPALVMASFSSAEIAGAAAPSPSAAAAGGAVLSALNRVPIMATAAPALPDLPEPIAASSRLSAAAAVTGLACTGLGIGLGLGVRARVRVRVGVEVRFK